MKNSCCRPLFSSIFDNSRENCIACCNAAGIPTKLIQPGLPAMQSTPMRPCAPPLFLKPWASLAWRGWGRGCGPGTNRSTAYLSTSSTGPSCCLVLNFFWIQCFYMPEPKRLDLRRHAGHVVLRRQRSQDDLNVYSPCICLPECPVQVGTGCKGKQGHGFIKDVEQSWGNHIKGGSICPATQSMQSLLPIITHYRPNTFLQLKRVEKLDKIFN